MFGKRKSRESRSVLENLTGELCRDTESTRRILRVLLFSGGSLKFCYMFLIA